MSLLAATRRAFKLSSFASTSRALATAVEGSAPAAAPVEAPVAPSAQVSPTRPSPLPLPSKPQPDDAFVHVPLRSFYTPPAAADAASPASSSSSDRLIVPLPAPLFNTPSRPDLLHKIITAHLSSLRQGSASTKNRSEVRYSGKKTRPQKGTGRARLGSRGSPMLRGGGRAFGPRPKGPEGWLRKINRKEEQLGLRVALSEKWRTGNLAVVDKLGLDQPLTRVLRQKLATRGWTDALFITSLANEEEQSRAAFELAAGNLPEVALVSDVSDMTVWDIVKRRKVILELDAVDDVVERVDPYGPWVEDELAWEDFEDEVGFEDGATEFAVEEALAQQEAAEARA
ncbi:hypothetical protein JCM11251_001207 [Rhodosporidiobolus azoricus]